MNRERLHVRERELVEAGFSPPYSLAMAHLNARDERARTGEVVIKGAGREWLVDRMAARCRFYLDHFFEDSATEDWRVFVHNIVSESGAHRHQGGLVLFALKGTGATIMDGVRYEWEAGDLVVMPVKPDQVEHQHFAYTEDAQWLAFIYSPMWQSVASTLTPTKDRPGWDLDR